MNKKILLLIAILSPLWAIGQQNIIPPSKQVTSSFAIIVDSATYSNCKQSIKIYKDMLEEEGLATYIISAVWQSPEHVKYFLQKYYNEQNLEGAVFIGDIPIAMIRKAQHMTSAFKMDEERFPKDQSSVPSDRFYDDFNLKFKFIGKDSLKKNFFYYNLRGDSEQKINCSIYTGRIKPTKGGKEGYEQINNYIAKLSEARSKKNPLDMICSYTGEGSFSNSLAAWKDEQVTLKEQIPTAFVDGNNARFYMFYMYPYMKESIINELKREELDFMVFHEHGMPYRQYLTGIPVSYSDDDFFNEARVSARERIRTVKSRKPNEDISAYMKKMSKDYGLDSLWFKDVFSKEMIAKDSIWDLKRGIILEDVREINPCPKVVVFDACYNGDFREESCIASEYIFSKGKSLVSFANSVNVLQDKSSSDLFGMLWCGARVGEWAKNVNILESHILGDPSFRFSKPDKLPNIRYNSKDSTYWLAVLEHNLPYDLKGLALHKLFNLKYSKLPDILLSTYKTSKSYMLRLQCMHLMAYYSGDYYPTLLKLASKDPYEFIRRKAAYYMGKVGTNDFIPYLVDMYIDNYYAERVVFNVISSSSHVNSTLLKAAFRARVEELAYIYDAENFIKNFEQQVDSKAGLRDGALEDMLNTKASTKRRMLGITMLRNNPYNQLVDDVFIILKNKKEEVNLRIAAVEALGWYERSSRRAEIISVCRDILKEPSLDASLYDELQKTINRLQTFNR